MALVKFIVGGELSYDSWGCWKSGVAESDWGYHQLNGGFYYPKTSFVRTTNNLLHMSIRTNSYLITTNHVLAKGDTTVG